MLKDKPAALNRHKDINITDILTAIIHEVINRVPLFSHIQKDKILICTASNKKNCRGGTFGKVVPMRFENGEEILSYKNRFYAMPRIIHKGKQILYIVYFYIPRFFDLSTSEKLRVIFHELYHISPDFNGDIRRFGKMKISHGHSRKKFDSLFEEEMMDFHKYITDTDYMKFLCLNTSGIKNIYRKVLHQRMKVPRPVLLESRKAASSE